MRRGGSRSPWELPARPGAAGPTPPSKVPVPLPRSPCPPRGGRARRPRPHRGDAGTGPSTGAIPATWGDLAAAPAPQLGAAPGPAGDGTREDGTRQLLRVIVLYFNSANLSSDSCSRLYVVFLKCIV